MHDNSSLGDYLSEVQRKQIGIILCQSEIDLISCLFWRITSPDLMHRRTLPDSLLYVPVTGRLWCRIVDAEAVIEPGEFMLVSEGVEHEARLAGGCGYFEAYAVHLHAHTHQGKPLFSIFTSAIGKMVAKDFWFEQLSVLTHLMGIDQEIGRRFGHPLIRNLLINQITAGNPLREIPSADDPRLWAAVYRILTAFPRPLTVGELAGDAGISEVQFRKLFRQYTGLSPKAYMQRLRLRKARVLFQTDPRITVKEVAQRTGFCDPHALHAAFKKAFGETPGSLSARPGVSSSA